MVVWNSCATLNHLPPPPFVPIPPPFRSPTRISCSPHHRTYPSPPVPPLHPTPALQACRLPRCILCGSSISLIWTLEAAQYVGKGTRGRKLEGNWDEFNSFPSQAQLFDLIWRSGHRTISEDSKVHN